MFKSKWNILAVLVALITGVVLLAGCVAGPTVTVTVTPPAVTPSGTPASVTITPSEAYNPIMTQHTLTAVVKTADGALVSGAAVEWFLNTSAEAVGDIVSLSGVNPVKVDNGYGTVYTDDKGEAKVTITSAREGDTDITAYVPGIANAAVHKQFAVKHWLDIEAIFPASAINAAGTRHIITVRTIKVTDGAPVSNVPVRFTISDTGPAASFVESVPSSNTITVMTDAYGFAVVTLQQTTPAQGANTVVIDVLAPFATTYVLATSTFTKEWQATNLSLTKDGPTQISLLADATYTITVKNSGELTATGVTLTDTIPAGMSYVSSSPGATVNGNVVTWNVGTMEMGATHTYTLVLKGMLAGLWTNTVVATSNEVGTASAQAVTRVIPAPEITLTKTGPSGIFTGFTRAYTLTVTNTGIGMLTDVVVTDTLPANLSYASSIPVGTVAGNQISWNMGTLAPGETKTIVAIFGGLRSGAAINTAIVTTHEGATATASLSIMVLGAPGAHMSLIDSSDPVAVGDTFVYTIKVVNQSETNTLHNLIIVALLPSEVSFVSADGSTTHTVLGQEIRFATVASLAAGATVEFHVTVRATAAGPAVFTATMNWDEFGEPIIDQEGTTVFLPQT